MNLFENKMVQIIQQHKFITANHLLVACSGGVDSMALLHFLHKNKERLQIEVSCVHVDHMLRGQQSYEDLLHVKAYCEERHIPFYGKSIPIPEILEESGGNVQAVCREERYAYFKKVLEETRSHYLVTAHHADDNVESILMSFTKNRSLNGLKGIEPVRIKDEIKIFRPFIYVTKVEIREYLKREGIAWREDPSNAKDGYTRNRFRNEIIPRLKQENEQFVENVLAISKQIREDDEYLMSLAMGSYKNIVTKLMENHYKLSVHALNREPVALQRRLILILLNYVYGNFHAHPTSQIIAQILALCETINGHGEVHLPDGILVRRSYEVLEIKKNTEIETGPKKHLIFNDWTSFGHFRIYFGKAHNIAEDLYNNHYAYFLDSTALSHKISVRPVATGDRLLVAGMEQPKKVSRIFIDAKIPALDRLNYPILEVDSMILAVGVLRHHPLLSKSKRPTDDLVIILQDDSL